MLNERCYKERMLQRTIFINKIRMLQRTQILDEDFVRFLMLILWKVRLHFSLRKEGLRFSNLLVHRIKVK